MGLGCCCCCCCCYSHTNSHSQVRGHRTGSSHSGAEEYPREETQTNQRWYTHISQLKQFMPPPETYNKWNPESAYDVPGPYWCLRLTTCAWNTDYYTACHRGKTTTYILHVLVVPITTHMHVRLKSIGKKEKREKKKRKEMKWHEMKINEKKRKGKQDNWKEKGKRKGKVKRKERKGKERREEEARKGRGKGKYVILADLITLV